MANENVIVTGGEDDSAKGQLMFDFIRQARNAGQDLLASYYAEIELGKRKLAEAELRFSDIEWLKAQLARLEVAKKEKDSAVTPGVPLLPEEKKLTVVKEPAK